jgi:hypothetical protein
MVRIRTQTVQNVTLQFSIRNAGRSTVHHTLGWRVSLADATETDLTPVTDSIMTVQNAHFLPQSDWFLQAAYFGSTGPTRARLITPSLRQITTPFVRPMNTDIVPGNLPGVADYRMNPLRLKALEEIQFMGMQTTGGAVVGVGLAFISKAPLVPMPAGDIYTLRGTGTTTLVAGAWSQVTVTWQDTLPQGIFAVVGGTFIGTTCLAGRCIFEDEVWRPGGIGTSAGDLNTSPIFLKGGMGEWGRFNSNRMPNIEFLANAADTAQEIYLDIIRIR